MESLPEPLVPADCDLNGMPRFMLDVDRLLASELVALARPEDLGCALLLWARAWKQRPAASLPDDDRVLAAFSGAGAKRWPAVKAMALRGFVKCSDGRLYHRVLAEEANEAWGRRQEYREKEGTKNERQKRWRDRVAKASAVLRERGVPVPAGASMETLDRLVKETDVDGDVDASASTVDVYRDAHETAKTGTGTGTGTDSPSSLRSEPPPDASPGAQPKRASRLDADWTLPEDWRAYARARHPRIDADREAERFRDHWHSKPGKDGRKADWLATWRNWLKNAEDRLPSGGGSALGSLFQAQPKAPKDWTIPIDHFVRTGVWGEPTPEPGKPGCPVPADLQKQALERRRAAREVA